MPRKGHSEEQIVYALRQAEGGQEGRRHLPGDGCIAAGVLQLEAAVRGVGLERTAGAAATAGREPQAEDLGGRSDPGQAHFAGGAVKKGLKPAARRELVRGNPAGYQLSENRACGLMGITRWINRYQSRRDPQDRVADPVAGAGRQPGCDTDTAG